MSDPSRSVEPPPTQQIDPWMYRIVVGALALALLGVVILGGVLALKGLTLPDSIVNLAFVAVGSLGALLAPSPAQRQ